MEGRCQQEKGQPPAAEKEEISDEDREELFNHIIEILPDVVAQNSILDISKEEFDIVLDNFYESLENDEYDNYMFDDPNFQVLKDILNDKLTAIYIIFMIQDYN